MATSGYTRSNISKDNTNSQGDPVYDTPKKEICADYSAVKAGRNG